MKVAIGIDIGGTNSKLGLVSPKGEMVSGERFSTRDCVDYQDFKGQLVECFRLLKENAHKRGMEVYGVGMGVPNYNPLTGYLESPPNLPWGNINFLSDMKSLFKMPTFIENDANVAAIGEGIFGEAQQLHNYISITVGTGIGTGIMVNGEILHGHTGIAGEGGHMVVVPDGRPCNCGGRGHFEAYCSVAGMKKTYQELTGETIHYRELFPRFLNGDQTAQKVFEQTAKHFAIALSQLSVLFSPEAIILAGGGMIAGEKYMDLICDEFAQQLYGPLVGSVRLILSEKEILNGAILGAASLVYKQNNET